MTETARQPGQVTTLATLRNPAENMPDVAAGFGSLKSFELIQRMAQLLCASTLVPPQYQAVIVKRDKYGNVKEQKANPNALANTVVALNMAQRMGADVLMIMPNLNVIEGRPSWSSQFIIAGINSCGKFSPLRFDLRELGAKTIEYVESFWENNQRQNRSVPVDIADVECIAWVIEKGSGERLEGPPVTIEMAVKEGWYTKAGSKWQTMPAVMLRYRAASFFGKLYAPELLMGLKTVEEELDIIEVAPETGDVLSVTTGSLKADMKRAETAQPADKTEQQPPPESKQEPPKKAATAPPAQQQTQPPPATEKKAAEPPPPEAPHPAEQQAPEGQGSVAISDVVKKYMREINQASEGGSVAVDQWRMKHVNRYLKDCNNDQQHPDFLAIRDYAQMVYDECKRAESEAAQQ